MSEFNVLGTKEVEGTCQPQGCQARGIDNAIFWLGCKDRKKKTSSLEDSPMGGILSYGEESLTFSVLFKFSTAEMRPLYIKDSLCLVHRYKY